MHGGDDSSSLLATVRQVRREQLRAVEDQFEVNVVNQGMNLAAITCPFMRIVAANSSFRQYPQASEDEVVSIMRLWGGGNVVVEQFRGVLHAFLEQSKSKTTLNVEAMGGNISTDTGMFYPTENRSRFYTTLACKAAGEAKVPCAGAVGRRAAAVTTKNAKFITFETLKAVNWGGPPFAMMLDMFGVDVPGGPKGTKGITVGKFEKLFFDGIMPHSNFQPGKWEVTSENSKATPTVQLAEALR